MIHLGVHEQMAIIMRDATIWRQKRHGPLWVDFVGLFRGYLCKRTWERPDRWESRACFRPVAVKQVKVDIGARRLEIRRFYREQHSLRVAIAKSEQEDAIQSRTSCNDEEAASQERLDPIAYGYWGRQVRGLSSSR